MLVALPTDLGDEIAPIVKLPACFEREPYPGDSYISTYMLSPAGDWLSDIGFTTRRWSYRKVGMEISFTEERHGIVNAKSHARDRPRKSAS